MSTLRQMNGVSYLIPDQGDTFIWGIDLSGWVGATSNGTLQKTGGAFTLSADADFGPNFGLKTSYLSSRGVVATAGVIRLANTDTIQFRNAAGTGNNILSMSGDTLTYSGTFSASTYANISANSLTGTTLASNVTASSLTSLGTLSALNLNGNITTTGTIAMTGSNTGIEIGTTTASNTPFLDFHSSGNSVDYDVRLIASGGSGSSGQGTLSIQAAALSTNAVTVTSLTSSGIVTVSGNSYTQYGPNTSWGAYLRVGGNGTSVGQTFAQIATSNGNLHMDAATNNAMFLNYNGGTSGVNFCNGNQGITASVSAAGAMTAASFNGPLNGNAATVTSSPNRTDPTSYPVVWNTSGGTSQNYSCAAVTITSSNGSINASLFNGLQLNSSSGVASRIVVADGSGYINNSYFNGTDEGTSGTAGTVTSILTKRGDNYYRSTTAQSVMNYLVGTSNTWSAGSTNYFASTGNTGPNAGANLMAYATTGSGNGAYMSFHRAGVYAINMGLDSDNVFRIGGWSAAANRLQMDMSGNLTMAGDITAYSDERLKEDIVLIPDALKKLGELRGVTFTRKKEKTKGTGLIAQEVQKVLPEAVHEQADGMLSVAYGNMVGLLIEAIKELNAEVKALKALVRGA